MQIIKYSLLTLLLFISVGITYAQEETITRTNKDRVNITEKFSVLKQDKNIRQGLYQAYYDIPFSKTSLAASGMYDHGKKVGVWHYYGRNGSIIQHYDFTHNKLLYTVPDTTSKYSFDAQFKEADTLTRPIKIGGLYGFYDMLMANYTSANSDMRGNGKMRYTIIHTFGIDAAGKLISYKLLITAENGFNKTYNIGLGSLSDDDLLFVPATLNKVPIASTVSITVISERF